jgi:hypothetical protein
LFKLDCKPDEAQVRHDLELSLRGFVSCCSNPTSKEQIKTSQSFNFLNGISVTKVEPGGVDLELSAIAALPLETPAGAQCP